MHSAAKLRRECNVVDQISPTPMFVIKQYAKIEVVGRGGAYKLTLKLCISVMLNLWDVGFVKHDAV